MCPIKTLFSFFALFAIFSTLSKATDIRSIRRRSPSPTPAPINYEYGCESCPSGWNLVGEECVKYIDFHKQGLSEKHISLSGFTTKIDLEVDAKFRAFNKKNGKKNKTKKNKTKKNKTKKNKNKNKKNKTKKNKNKNKKNKTKKNKNKKNTKNKKGNKKAKVILGLENKGIRHPFVVNSVWLKPGETKMISGFLKYKDLQPKDYDLEARQYYAKSWVTLRVQCKVPPPPTTCPPPVVCPTPTPTPTPETVCKDFVATMPETCDGTQTQHGLWLGRQGPLDPLFDELWQGPIPLVTPADFQQDGTSATLIGVVTNGTSYWKYEFKFSGLSQGQAGYFQDLLSGCSQPDDSDWSFYQQFNGTLTNLATGSTYELVNRGGVHVPQVGMGASLFDTEYGISFWFKIPNTRVIGDVNLSLRCVSKA